MGFPGNCPRLPLNLAARNIHSYETLRVLRGSYLTAVCEDGVSILGTVCTRATTFNFGCVQTTSKLRQLKTIGNRKQSLVKPIRRALRRQIRLAVTDPPRGGVLNVLTDEPDRT